MAVNADMADYYRRRAATYERVYHKPQRQADLRAMEAWIAQPFAGREGLEIACGTGWWTPHAARDSRHWLATDLNPETIAIARAKPLPPGKVTFEIADAYDLRTLGERRFDAAFAGCWWSHVPLQKLSAWVDGVHARLRPGARVVVLDNRYVDGDSTPISRRDAFGNGYQTRHLDDGSAHEVLKNYPTADGLRQWLGARAGDFAWHEWTYFWAAEWTPVT
jgi:demethylmenaquinone methyltransferase/2-methoxy-6-polyprenyl-1,4-benzoquinol methylase